MKLDHAAAIVFERRRGDPSSLAGPQACHGTALDELARLARTAGEKIDDPRPALFLDEIDLRVMVELAKLDAGL